MSLSTLVSFARRDIFETIPGLKCAFYSLPRSEDPKKPTILIVEDSHYLKPDIEGNNDEVFVPSAQIANGVVTMHITSQLGFRSGEAHPALFAIPDMAVDEKDLGKYQKEVDRALRHQKAWFTNLVRMADDDWQISHRHNMISDIQRTAARELKLERPYLMAVEFEDIEDCPFCAKSLLNADAPICPNCMRVLNPEKLAEIEKRLGITPAKMISQTVKA